MFATANPSGGGFDVRCFRLVSRQPPAALDRYPRGVTGHVARPGGNMGYGLRRSKIEGGSGSKRGHSNMVHWEYTEEIKQRSRKARRRAAKALERDAKQTRQ